MAKVKDQRAVKVYDENGNIIAGSRPSNTNSYTSNTRSLNEKLWKELRNFKIRCCNLIQL